MEHFVHRQNLILYRKQLAVTTDEPTREQLLARLAEEEQKDKPAVEVMLDRHGHT